MIATIEKIRSKIPKTILITTTHAKINNGIENNKEIDSINSKLRNGLKIFCKTPAVINNIPDIIVANGWLGIFIAIKLPQNIKNSNKIVAIILKAV